MPPSLFQFANFNVVKGYVFPVWLAIIPPVFIVLEVLKQSKRVSAYWSPIQCVWVIRPKA